MIDPIISGLNVRSIIKAIEKFTNTIYIEKPEDFKPVGGVAQLEDDTKYVLVNPISYDFKIIPAQGAVSIITSDNTSGNPMTYTGTGKMFEANALGGAFFITQIRISCPNGTVFDIQDINAPGFGTILFETMQFVLCLNMGTIKDVRVIGFFSQELLTGPGLVLDGCSSITYSHMNNQLGLNLAGTKLIEILGNNGAISWNDNFMSANSNETIYNIDSSSTTTGGVSVSTQVELATGAVLFDPAGKDETDIFWTYFANPGMPDSTSLISVKVGANALATTVILANVFYQINANTWTEETGAKTQRIRVDTDGVIEYFGREDVTLKPDAVFTLQNSIGGAQRLAVQYLNIHAHDSTTVTFDNTNDLVLESGHTKIAGDQITFYDPTASFTLPTGLAGNKFYYVGSVTPGVSYKLYHDAALSILATFTDNGTGTIFYSDCQLVGDEGFNSTAGNNLPTQMETKGAILMETGDKLMPMGKNVINAINFTAVGGITVTNRI